VQRDSDAQTDLFIGGSVRFSDEEIDLLMTR